ncbi:hypothetical protein BJ944DRAFT_165069 [Cunninghamella echinulata]|nr:hypothetical protein BJ944DRAFT_165069 [Cunninghamella echinulata]
MSPSTINRRTNDIAIKKNSQNDKEREVKEKNTKPFAHIQPSGSWELPRKLYHYSIAVIYPPLTVYLFIVLTAEFLRFRYNKFNIFYCKILGPLMRKTEINSRYNGVVYYLAASLSIVYLSWTDPTASICGRLWGKYTIKFGKKSLAGSLGGWVVGTVVTYYFFGQWQYISWTSVKNIAFPSSYDPMTSQVPLWVVAVYGGCVASFSEFICDSLGSDDNITIPVLSASLLWLAFYGTGILSSSFI